MKGKVMADLKEIYLIVRYDQLQAWEFIECCAFTPEEAELRRIEIEADLTEDEAEDVEIVVRSVRPCCDE